MGQDFVFPGANDDGEDESDRFKEVEPTVRQSAAQTGRFN